MNYTVKEVAKKLRVSEGHIYELIKRGELSKVDGLGRTIRIPSKELSNIHGRDYFLYNPKKIKVISTTLGKIRKIQDFEFYVLVDVVKAIGVNDSYSIVKAVDKKYVTKFNLEEAREYGLFSNNVGILLISADGLRQYKSKTRYKDRTEALVNELGIGVSVSITPKEDIQEVIDTDLTPIELALGVDKEGKTTARKLYKFLELDPSNYSKWIKRNIDENQFAEKNKDFEVFVLNDENPLGGRPTTDYKLSASFAKKLAMGTHNEKGEAAKNYFVKIEEKVKQNSISSRAPQVNNMYLNFSENVRRQMKADLENKNKKLFIEKAKIDSQLMTNLEIIKSIETTLD